MKTYKRYERKIIDITLGFGKVIKGKNCRYAKELLSLLQDASVKNNTIHSLTVIEGASIIKELF